MMTFYSEAFGVRFRVVKTRGHAVKVNYAIVFVSDMRRAVAFYRDVLGLRLRFETPTWTEFATEGATLALHASDEPVVETIASHHGVAGRCRPGLSVPKLDEFHERMTAHQVPCLQEPTETFGVRIAQYVDPDGLVIAVSEQKQE
jgi:lactoylglutathione lyase